MRIAGNVRRNGLPPRATRGGVPGPFLGYWSLSPSRAAVGNELDRLYGSNWPDQLRDSTGKAVTDSQVSAMLSMAIDKYQAGYERGVQGIPALANEIAAAVGVARLSAIKLLMLMDSINSQDAPQAASVLSPAGFKVSAIGTQIATQAGRAGSSVKEGAIDTLKESGNLVISSISDVQKKFDQNAPWYLKTKVLIPAVLVGLGLWYFQSAKNILGLKRKPSYQSNPVKGRREKAEKLFETFHDAKPKKRVSIPKVETDEMVLLGDALQLGYKSKKWTGKNADYLHDFGKAVKLYATADGKSLVMTGGEMIVKSDGINN